MRISVSRSRVTEVGFRKVIIVVFFGVLKLLVVSTRSSVIIATVPAIACTVRAIAISTVVIEAGRLAWKNVVNPDDGVVESQPPEQRQETREKKAERAEKRG